jgi:hypothetical protein
LLTGAALARAGAAECSRVVLVALPGVTWQDVERARPPALLAAARSGALGSISVRVGGPRTPYDSGFATLGAGARLQGVPELHLKALEPSRAPFVRVQVGGLRALRAKAAAAGYGAAPGALAEAITEIAAIGDSRLALHPSPPGDAFEQPALVGAMDASGTVPFATVGGSLLRTDHTAPFGIRSDRAQSALLLSRALKRPCGVTLVSEGDLIRADQWSLGAPKERAVHTDRALRAVDRLVSLARGKLDRSSDLLLILSPTSPAAVGQAHLGVAIAEGPGYPAGTRLMSASTRRSGIVTLTDVAPTVLDHLGIETPASMTGRPWFTAESTSERIDAAVETDREAVFVDDVTRTAALAFIALQVVVCGAAAFALWRRSPLPLLQQGALAVIAFPLATFVMGALPGHSLGGGFLALLVALDAAAVAAVTVALRRPLDRLLALTAMTTGLLILDLLTGARLQINTILGYSPIVGGRFAGIGNMAFAVLASAALATAALMVHRTQGTRTSLVAAAVLLGAVVVVDGAPLWGSDVGGIIALVPAYGVALLLLAGVRLRLRTAAALAVAALLVLALFLVVDLARPPEARTHLARLYENVSEQGLGALTNTIERKAAANLRLLTSSVWALSVPPALACLTFLSLWPAGIRAALRDRLPAMSAGLLAALVLALLGFAVNDSGIAIPSMVLAFFVPYALIARLYSPGPLSL